jgi:hypothetical protein
VFARNIQRVVVGSAIAIVSTALFPVIKETLRPIARDLTRQMKYFVVITKEGIEDLAAEVKFERLRKSLDKDIFIESEGVETEHQNRIFQ